MHLIVIVVFFVCYFVCSCDYVFFFLVQGRLRLDHNITERGVLVALQSEMIVECK